MSHYSKLLICKFDNFLFYFIFILQAVNHPLTNKTTKKTGLEGEVIDIITKKSEDSVESIANFVLQYLDSKTDSRWIVGVARGAEFAHSKKLRLFSIKAWGMMRTLMWLPTSLKILTTRMN